MSANTLPYFLVPYDLILKYPDLFDTFSSNSLFLALAAKARTKELLEKVSSKSGYFRLKSHGLGKYGRVLGEIFIEDSEGKQWNINETLIAEGHAYVYDGGTKKVFTS